MASANGGVRGCPGRLHRFCGVSSRRRPHCLSCWTLPIGAPGDSGSKPPGSTRPISFPRSARTTRTPHSGWPHDCGSGRREGPGGDQAGGLVLRLKSTRDASSSRRCGTTSHSRRSSRHLGVADFDALLIMGCVEQHFVRFDCFLVEDFAHPALRQIGNPCAGPRSRARGQSAGRSYAIKSRVAIVNALHTTIVRRDCQTTYLGSLGNPQSPAVGHCSARTWWGMRNPG
jgi:hypothetical protein